MSACLAQCSNTPHGWPPRLSHGVLSKNLAELHEAMMGAVLSSSDDTVLQFLCAHPELAGREMQEGKLTENFSLEQARAGLDALAPEEFRCLNSLNSAEIGRASCRERV